VGGVEQLGVVVERCVVVCGVWTVWCVVCGV
jgi:hypothetical protein